MVALNRQAFVGYRFYDRGMSTALLRRKVAPPPADNDYDVPTRKEAKRRAHEARMRELAAIPDDAALGDLVYGEHPKPALLRVLLCGTVWSPYKLYKAGKLQSGRRSFCPHE